MHLKDSLRTTACPLVIAATLGLSGCAAQPVSDGEARAVTVPVNSFAAGLAELQAGHPAEARELLSDAAVRLPTDASRQTALGFAYQLEGTNDPEKLQMALAGYRSALNSRPGAYWPAVLGGRAAFDLGRYSDAMSFFAQAVVSDPRKSEAFVALATAAYNSGDVVLASATAGRAMDLDPGSAEAVRIAALGAAAVGDSKRANLMLARYRTLNVGDADAFAGRLQQLSMTSASDEPVSPKGGVPQGATSPIAADQIAVDVAIVLSQNDQQDRVGLNLLDGLRMQFGLNSTRGVTNATGVTSTLSTLTRTITVPELDYNLNLFNRLGHYYQVVARPSLTAFHGEPSQFFVGKSLKVAVHGVNVSELDQIDVGVTLKVTPIEIDSTHTKIKVDAERSFLTQDPVGTFAEGLSTFRQTVSATANVDFGETLVLSGLSESVHDATQSKVPWLGDVPILGTAFNLRTSHEVRDAVLILLTPSRPVSLPGQPWARPDAVENLVRLWSKLIDPSSNGREVAARLSKIHMFTRMQPGDAPLSWPNPMAQESELIKALILSTPP